MTESLQLNAIAANLERGEDGIWYPKDRSAISYPVDGNIRSARLEEGSFWFNHRRDCIIEALRAFPPGGCVFDVGGGNGYVSLAMSQAGMEAILVEPGHEGAANARAKGLDPVVCATIEDAGFSPHVLPAAGLFDVLEHIEDDTGFLRSLHALLIPQGRLYLTVPAYNVLMSNEDERAGHFRRYTVRSLVETLESAGFVTDYATYFFVLLPIPILAFRTIPTRLGVRRKSRFARVQREHAKGPRWFQCVRDRAFSRELDAIRMSKRMRFGGSCLVVAHTS